MMKSHGTKKIAVDLVPVVAGKGGAGGGIWRHLISTLQAVDRQPFEGIEIICLMNTNSPVQFNRIRTSIFSLNARGFVGRMLWIHIVLPLWCLIHRIDVLHRVTAERPILVSSRVISNIHDFMSEHYRENHPRRVRIVEKLKNLYFSWMTRFSLHHSSICLFLSHAVSEEATRRYGKTSAPHVVLWGGVDEREVVSFDALASTGKNKSITVVAAFHRHKGHVQALRAFEVLIGNYYTHDADKPRLVFRGHIADKEYWEVISNAIANSPHTNLIDVVSYDEGADIKQIYANASIVMLLSEYEGLGLPLLEAQMQGIPVVCSDILVFQEILADSALRVSSDNSDEVAKACHSLLTDSRLRSALIQRGLTNCRRFVWGNAASACLGAYRHILHAEIS